MFWSSEKPPLPLRVKGGHPAGFFYGLGNVIGNELAEKMLENSDRYGALYGLDDESFFLADQIGRLSLKNYLF